MSQTISSKCGHGGARANSGGPRPNSGGARPGAGRPRKLVAPRRVPNEPRWLVYQTHPHAESIAAEDLTRLGYRCYAPLIAVQKRADNGRYTRLQDGKGAGAGLFRKVRIARFPGYGFCELAAGAGWQRNSCG